MAHSSDISSTLANNSRNSRIDDSLPEPYLSPQDQRQQERTQFLASPDDISRHSQSWAPPHAAYIHPSDQIPKQGYANNAALYHNPSLDGKRTKILGIRRRYFFTALILLLLLIVGGVLGGVLGSTAAKNSGVTQSSPASQGDSSSTSAGASASTSSSPTSSRTTTTTTSSAATSSASSVVVKKGAFKFPSVAVGHANNNTHVFSLRSANNSIAHHTKSGSNWLAQANPNLPNPPAEGSSLTVLVWGYAGQDQIRLYYIDEDSQIIELTCVWEEGNNCKWAWRNDLAKDVSLSAGLAAVHWGNGSVSGGDHVRVFYANEKNALYQQRFDSGLGWQDPNSLGYTISEGTGLSSVIPLEEANPLRRVFYVDDKGVVKCLRGEDDFSTSTVDFTDQSSSESDVIYNMTRPASLASCLHWGGSGSASLFLSVKQISDSGDVVEAWQNSATAGSYYVEPMYDCPRGDDPGGAIAAVGFLDEALDTSQLFVYSVGGAITECWWHNRTVGSTWGWAWTSNLIHT